MQTFLRTRKRGGYSIAFLSILAATIVAVGCGDVYRPVANPVLQPGGDPQSVRLAFLINNNNGGLGSVSTLDVSGDTNLGNSQVGVNPVHGAVQAATGRVFVANQGDDTVSAVSTSNTIPSATITMPAGSKPSFVAPGSSTTMYVLTPGTVPPTVSVLDTTINVFSTAIAVGNDPVAAVAAPDNSRLFVMNRADGTVSVITAGNTVVTQTIAVGASPVWGVVSSDSTTLWVVNQGSNSVSVIQTSSGTVTATIPVGTAPRFAAYESHLNRLYVANAGSNSISVIDVSTEQVMATVTVGSAPAMLTPLADGTRVYVANSGCADVIALSGCTGNTVTVVDAANFGVRKTITVGTAPIAIVSANDGSKVVVMNRDSNNASFIRTSDDTVINTVPSGAPKPVWVALLG